FTSVRDLAPVRAAGFHGRNPRVLMNLAAVPDTGFIGPGTRARYKLHLRAPGEMMAPLIEQLTPTLAANQELEARDNAGLRSMGPLRQLTLWGQLAVMMVVLLCGGAVYLAAGVRSLE